MHRRITRLITTTTTLVALALASAAFAQAAAEPAEPGLPRPGAGETMVRFLNASPNADAASIMLVGRNGAGAYEALTVGYLEATEYLAVFEGSYDIVVETTGPTGEPTQLVLDDTFNATPGLYSTVALVGLATPDDATDDDGGFFDWLQGIFTDDGPDLGLRAVVLDDHSTQTDRVGNVEVRLLHAAPGTDDVDLVLAHEGASSVLGSASFGDWTEYSEYRPGAGTLQVRAAGSDLVIAELTDVELSEDLIHTVVLAGTPVEDVPIEAVVVSNEWIDPMLAGAGMAGMHGALTPEATMWVLDFVLAAEARLAEAHERLATIEQVDAAGDDARIAREAVDEARQFLAEARLQLETFAVPGATPPVMPSDEPGADPATAD